MRNKCSEVLMALGLVVTAVAAGPPAGAVISYKGLCNASAAVAIDGDRFLVADDEDKPTTFLRVYRSGQPDGPLFALPLPNDALELDLSEDLEVDIEGAARIGDRVYWIGSHSTNKNGKERPNRHRLFATKVTTEGAEVRVEVVNHTYKSLIDDLDHDHRYSGFGLKEAGRRPPKADGGLSIEGLAATPDGDLLIGFRNPVLPHGKALIARLKNPKGVTNGKPADFGAPIQLDLNGLGVRSMERAETLNAYLIIGGPPGEGSGSRLFRWSGDPGQRPEPVPGVDLTSLNPEALYVEDRTATVLSDDGRRAFDGQERDCAAPGVLKSFRGLKIPLSSP
jgi:Protein of unknown function (DUF3616)